MRLVLLLLIVWMEMGGMGYAAFKTDSLTFSQDNITSNTNKIGLGNTGAKWTVETKDVWGGTFPILAPNSSLGGYGIIEGGIYVMNPDGVSTTAIGLYNQAGTNYWQFETDTSSGSANLDLFTSSTGSFNIANNILANGKLSVGNAAASAGVLTLLEDNDAGSNYASFQVPALAANTVYTLPSDDGDAGEQLQTNGAGALTWEAAGGAGGGAPTNFKGITIESPTDADNFFMFEAPFALTITRIMGIVESATAAVLTAQECDSAGDNCVTIEGLSADVDGTITTGGDIDNPAIDAGDIIRCDVGAVVGTVGQAHLTITFTKND